jgi:type IV pilus assembly protein PilB
MDPLNLDEISILPSLALKLPAYVAWQRLALPCSIVQGKLQVAVGVPPNPELEEALIRHLGEDIRLFSADPESIRRQLRQIHPQQQRTVYQQPGRDQDSDETIRISDEIIRLAAIRGASDIHLDPRPDGLHVRLRIDGVLELERVVPLALQAALISRLKVLAGMDIAEKRAAQDGRIRHRLPDGREVDLRAASIPAKLGEKLTLRLIGLGTSSLHLDQLGLTPGQLSMVTVTLSSPHGLVLVCGATGSGKSTTLYAMLRHLVRNGSPNIITIEDPVEAALSEVTQVEIESEKITFSAALRSVLRHDPDIIMVGEIRDRETADIAIRAALTGHLVLSSLHANTAIGAVTRLQDMGIEPYLIGATLRLSIAQRLMRRLCTRCHKAGKLSKGLAMAFRRPELEGAKVFHPVGCLFCAGKGYRGRIGVFEFCAVSEEASRLIAANAGEAKLDELQISEGHQHLSHDAIEKMSAGLISPEDLLMLI